MRAHLVGRSPGIAAPDAAASVHAAGIASVAADRVPPVQLMSQEVSAPAARAAEIREPDHTSGSATDPQTDKVFRTLQAELALKGHCLSRTYAGDGSVLFYVTRWGMVRELRDLVAVRAFAAQVGCSHA